MENQLDQNKLTVLSFARDGIVVKANEGRLCEAIDKHIMELLQQSLPKSLDLSRKLVRQSKIHSSRIKFESFRAIARSTHMSGIYEEAAKYYLLARKHCGGDDLLKAKLDRTLIDVYMYLGEFGKAKRRFNLAMKVFQEQNNISEQAKARVNLANILHRKDKHEAAAESYYQAYLDFEKMNDKISQARSLFNLANTQVQLFELSKAETYFNQSADIYESYGYKKDALDARWGLAWMHMLQGKFHVALKELHACENEYRKIGVKLRVASCILDRSEVYLQLNLFTDSLECATVAEKMFKNLKVRYEMSKAALYRAYSAAALGKHRIAKSAIIQARNGFKKDNNLGFLGAISLLESKISTDKNLKINHLKTASKLFSRGEFPLWQAFCDIHSAFEPSLSKQSLNRLSRNRAAQEIPSVYAAYQVLLGDLSARSGKMKKAAFHWKKAANRIDTVKSLLPPVGLRDQFGKELQNPHQRLISTYARVKPLEASIWSERFKTSGLWAPPPNFGEALNLRKDVDHALSDLSDRISFLSRQVFRSNTRMKTASYNSQQIENMGREIRNCFIKYEQMEQKTDPDNSILKNRFRNISAKMPIVQIHVNQRDIISFVHYNGETKSHILENGKEKIERLSAQWSFLMESEALRNGIKSNKQLDNEYRLFRKLGELLWSPLEIPTYCRNILLIPEGIVTSLPWPAFVVNDRPLVEIHQFVISPSLRHYLNANQVRTKSEKVKVFVGDITDIKSSATESDMVKNLFGENASIVDPCKRDSWPRSGHWNIWHYSGHAQLNINNPFYSSLSLSDGSFFAADLRLRNVSLNLATIAACHSGTDVALPGEESMGFVRSFLEMGARNVLAGLWSVFDTSSVDWMNSFYKGVNSGNNTAVAAQTAALDVRDKYGSAYYWAVFSIFGAGK